MGCSNWVRVGSACAAGLAVSVLIGCASTSVEPIRTYSGSQPLPKPDRILISDFAVSPGDVSLNSGIGARLADAVKGQPKSEEQLKVGRAVAKAFSEELVKEIQGLGLPAEQASRPPSSGDTTLTIKGQFVSIDEGNRARRMVIGFGVGGTEVRTRVQVYQGTPTGRLLVQEFETSAQSSKKPGMGPMAGVGAAATGAAGTAAGVSGGVGVATEFNQTVEGNARRTAQEVAKKLAKFFVDQGWIPRSKAE